MLATYSPSHCFSIEIGFDAPRDILMSLVSMIKHIVMANNHPHSYFIRLTGLGKKSNDWINVFDVDLPKAKYVGNKITDN